MLYDISVLWDIHTSGSASAEEPASSARPARAPKNPFRARACVIRETSPSPQKPIPRKSLRHPRDQPEPPRTHSAQEPASSAKIPRAVRAQDSQNFADALGRDAPQQTPFASQDKIL